VFGNEMLDIIFTPWASHVLNCACNLNVFDLLNKERMTLEQLASEVGAVPRFLKSLLDACSALGFIEQNEKKYENSSMAKIYLVKEAPLYLGDIIDVMSAEASKWSRLDELMKGKELSKPKEIPKKVSSHRFTMAMNNLAMLGEANTLANSVKLSNCKRMADVGCGSGLYSITLCQHNSGLHALLFDREDVLITTNHMITKYNLQNRMKTRAADIYKDSYGEGLDLILLSDILYQEESICRAILKSAYDALDSEGLLVIRGYYTDSVNHGSIFGALFNLAQLLDDPNREAITVSLVKNWIDQTGFLNIKSFPLTEKSTCIISQKP